MKKVMKEEKKRIDRRQFLKNGSVGAAAVGLTCLNFGGLREALALARQTGKPILNETNLNAIIPKSPDGLRSFGGEVKRDLKALLHNRFAVTSAQEREINNLSPSDIKKIHQAIDKAVELKVPLRVTIKGASRASLTRTDTLKASFTSSPGAPVVFLLSIDFHIGRDGVSLKVSK